MRAGLTLMLFLGRLDKRSSPSAGTAGPAGGVVSAGALPVPPALAKETPRLALSPSLPGGVDLKETVAQAIASLGRASPGGSARWRACCCRAGHRGHCRRARHWQRYGEESPQAPLRKLHLRSRAELFHFFLNHLITVPSGTAP